MTKLREFPIEGKYGTYGGKYIPETLVPAINELENAYEKMRNDSNFKKIFVPAVFENVCDFNNGVFLTSALFINFCALRISSTDGILSFTYILLRLFNQITLIQPIL